MKLPGPSFIHSVSFRNDVQIPRGYPFNIPAIRDMGLLMFHPNVTFFVGDNGMGKSTLLEALAVKSGLNAEGGSRNFRFETRRTHSNLEEYLWLERSIQRPTDDFFLRAESFYNVASEVEDLGVSGYGARSLHAQSHGESFWALLDTRFRGDGLYFLDEPEAALSPLRQLAAIARIHQLVKYGNSQLVIATHSPILLAYPYATIYLYDETGIHEVAYEETEHYQVTRSFLNNPERSLRELLSDEGYEGEDLLRLGD